MKKKNPQEDLILYCVDCADLQKIFCIFTFFGTPNLKIKGRLNKMGNNLELYMLIETSFDSKLVYILKTFEYFTQPLTGLLFRNFFEITSRNLGVVVRALGGSAGEFRCATTPTGL